MAEGTAIFRQARDFLLAHREDYATAYEGFRWPELGAFNWALDWFDVIAEGNDDPALWIVEEDGSELKLSFAEMAERSARVANWLRDQGVARGDRIVLMLGNQVELWDTVLAAMKLGAVLIPATPLLGPGGELAARAGRAARRPAGGDARQPGRAVGLHARGDEAGRGDHADDLGGGSRGPPGPDRPRQRPVRDLQPG